MLNQPSHLSFEDVNFAYGNSPLIEDLNFTITEGEHLCITGKNGCGKTTIFKLALGLIIPDSGEVIVLGHNTKQPCDDEWRPSVSALFQRPENQIVNLSVIDDIMFTLKNLGYEREICFERSIDVLTTLGIEHLQDRLISELSGGEVQMVAFAGALVMHPKLIILDEPTSFLDSSQKARFYRVIKSLKDSARSILSITHEKDFAKIADRVLNLA